MDTQIQSMLYDSQKKSAGIAYLLLVLLGGLGVHRFYLGQKWQGLIRLSFFILMLICLMVTGVSAVNSAMNNVSTSTPEQAILGFIAIISSVATIALGFYDLFTLHSSVKKINVSLIQRLSQKDKI